MQELITAVAELPEYQLLDSGDGLRLESWAGVTVVRPEPNVLWPASHPKAKGWQKPDARFVGEKNKNGWEVKTGLEAGWPLVYGNAHFLIKPSPFRHVGLFPEQQPNWLWLQEKLGLAKGGTQPRVLNLFAYTGAASIVARQAGAFVCHVDASAGSIYWAQQNAQLSGLGERDIRWIQDDVSKFLHREQRRAQTYDLIIMDPPVFGRGPKGEIWRLEQGILDLINSSLALLSPNPLGLLINFYATSLYPGSLVRLIESRLQSVGLTAQVELVSLNLFETSSKKLLPAGYSLRVSFCN